MPLRDNHVINFDYRFIFSASNFPLNSLFSLESIFLFDQERLFLKSNRWIFLFCDDESLFLFPEAKMQNMFSARQLVKYTAMADATRQQ